MEKLGFTVPEAAALSSLGQTSYLQGDQARAVANPQIWYAHHHHAHRSGLLLGNLPDEPERAEG